VIFSDPLVREADRTVNRLIARGQANGWTIQQMYDNATPEESDALTVLAIADAADR
jgi:hypothetical protein